MVAAHLPEVLAQTVRQEELEHLRGKLLVLEDVPDAGLTGRDLLGALAVFLLVFLSTLPVVVPFLFPLEAKVALRISNAIAIALLFLVGLRVGRYVSYRPLLVGLGSVALGALLVAITIALGG
jgi:VIT1/CCC1 family predicted Fe2+/Mn2+ transporter